MVGWLQRASSFRRRRPRHWRKQLGRIQICSLRQVIHGIAKPGPFRSKLKQPAKLRRLRRTTTTPPSVSPNPDVISMLQLSSSPTRAVGIEE